MTEHHELVAHLQLREDELLATKRLVQSGRVLIHRRVVRERRTIHIPVTREELSVERVPADQWSAADAEAMFVNDVDDDLIHRLQALRPGESIRLPLVEEEVVIDKQVMVVEEVTIGTRQVPAMQQVAGVVRREQARIENTEVAGVPERADVRGHGLPRGTRGRARADRRRASRSAGGSGGRRTKPAGPRQRSWQPEGRLDRCCRRRGAR